MMHTTLNGMEARRYANYGRGAGIVILACAGGLWALPLPGMKEMPAKPMVAAPAPAAEQAPAVSAAAKIDANMVDEISTRLDLAVVHAPAPKVTEETKTVVHEADPTAPEWTYLGPIHEATRNLAIISIEGHQKIMAEGRTFGAVRQSDGTFTGGTKLVSVLDDHIVVENGGSTKSIDRGQRDPSKSVAWMRNLQNNTPPTRVGNGQPGAQPNLPPEVRARMAERGFTPDQIANWQRGNGGRGGAGGGPGGGGGGGGQNNGDRRNRATPGGGGDQRGNQPGTRGELRQQSEPLMKPTLDMLVVDRPRSVN